MDNRPVGREKRVLSGGEGIKRSGEGLGKSVSARNVKKADKAANQAAGNAAKGILGGLFKKPR